MPPTSVALVVGFTALVAVGLSAGCLLTSDLDDLNSGPVATSGGAGGNATGASGGRGGTGGTTDGGGGATLTCPTGQKPCGAECVSIDQPATGCAAESCAPCDSPNAITACFNGACSASACVLGYRDCNADLVDGCEIHLDTDTGHCGSCGEQCSFQHAGAQCATGNCLMATCDAGFEDCDGDPSNGCEANIDNDPNRCGNCTMVCPDMGATAVCIMGQCDVSGCIPPTADCDGVVSDDCETNTDTSLAHCGFCNNPCVFNNGVPACNAGSCELDSCVGSFGNCDGNDSNGCETDLDVSGTHCGFCGRDCFGGACVDGVCQPVTLSSGDRNPADMKVDGQELFWANPDQIKKVNFATPGAQPVVLGPNEESFISNVELDANYIYWTLADSVRRVDRNGGTPETVVDGIPSPFGLALVSASSLVFTNYTTFGTQSSVWTVPPDGSIAPLPLTNADGPRGLATAGGAIYFADSNTSQIFRYELGVTTELAAGTGTPWLLRTDGVDVFWTDINQGEVNKVSINGGPVTLLADVDAGSAGLALDATHVYFTHLGDGTVSRVPKGGGAIEVLYDGMVSTYGIVVTSDRVFWGNYTIDGSIMMLAK